MSKYILVKKSSGAYLMHHGVKNQKWGKKNGPPYPLERLAGEGERIERKDNGSIKIIKDKYNKTKNVKDFIKDIKTTIENRKQEKYYDKFKKDKNININKIQKDYESIISKKEKEYNIDKYINKALDVKKKLDNAKTIEERDSLTDDLQFEYDTCKRQLLEMDSDTATELDKYIKNTVNDLTVNSENKDEKKYLKSYLYDSTNHIYESRNEKEKQYNNTLTEILHVISKNIGDRERRFTKTVNSNKTKITNDIVDEMMSDFKRWGKLPDGLSNKSKSEIKSILAKEVKAAITNSMDGIHIYTSFASPNGDISFGIDGIENYQGFDVPLTVVLDKSGNLKEFYYT